jgi:5-methylcytosine-specific restriction endonuclease McrA
VNHVAKKYAKSFYKSKAWQDCRAGYISSVQGLCERCLSSGRYTPGYIVHHIKYITPSNIGDPDITLNWDNLEYLCHDCHNREHFANEYLVRDDVMFDDDGNLIQR